MPLQRERVCRMTDFRALSPRLTHNLVLDMVGRLVIRLAFTLDPYTLFDRKSV